MKRLILLLLIAFGPALLFAQEKIGDNVVYTSQDTSDFFSTKFNPEEINQAIKANPFQFNVEIGTSFGTNFGGGNYFGSYIAPQLTYNFTPRLSLSGGAMLSTGIPVSSFEPYGSNGLFSTNINRSFVYLKGAYQLTENLRLTGTVYKEMNVFNSHMNNYPGANFDYEGVIMGVDYKVGKSIFIHGEIEFSNGGNPYRMYQDPFRSNGFNSSPFNSMNDNPF